MNRFHCGGPCPIEVPVASSQQIQVLASISSSCQSSEPAQGGNTDWLYCDGIECLLACLPAGDPSIHKFYTQIGQVYLPAHSTRTTQSGIQIVIACRRRWVPCIHHCCLTACTYAANHICIKLYIGRHHISYLHTNAHAL